MTKRGSIVKEVVNDLRSKIKGEDFKDNRLPSEPDLAIQFGVSRNTIRQALIELEAESMINRKHGVGTYINERVINIGTRLEEVQDFVEIIENSGFSPNVRHVKLSLITPSKTIAKKLCLSEHEEVLRTANIFLADGEPVIYCVDYIPSKLVRSAYNDQELYGPVYKFLKKRCNQQVERNITEVIPINVQKELSEYLSCEPGSPAHYFKELALNVDDEPIMYSDEYYLPEYFSFNVVRKMISQ